LIGHSCGAHIIASLLLRSPPGEEIPGDDPLAPDVYDSVKGVALAEGIYDLDLLLKAFPDYRDFVQGAFEMSSASFSRFCVNRYKARNGITTQWLIVHSPGDTLVDLPQADAMYHHLRSEYLTIGSDPNKIERDFVTLTGGHDEILTGPEFVRLIKGMI
jgi:acetyl esterase/lipase